MKLKITLLLFTFFVAVISAQTVNIQGNPYGGNPYPGIQSAIDASNSGDIILISGTHDITAALAIPDKNITLRGSDPTTDVIQAGLTPGSGASRVISLFQPGSQAVNLVIENLGIKNGNSTSLGITRGGGIYIDGNYNGLVTLTNCIIEGNNGNEGGAIASLGTDLNITDCTIKNNSGTSGGALLVTVNDNNSDMVINISKSLFTGNTANNGGGIYINGNNGSSSSIDVNIENSTLTLNSAVSGTSGAGGGAIWGKARNNGSNINLELVHVTIDNNSHTSAVKNGLAFSGGGSAFSNVSIYNSIITNGDDVAQKSINWPKAKPLEIINSILGGSNAAGAAVDGVTANDFLDNGAKNNLKGRTATQAGLATSLTSEGGNTQVLVISGSSSADDYCTAATGISLPNVDQRGYDREGTVDAGAYEIGGTLSIPDVTNNLKLSIYPNPTNEYFYISDVSDIQSIKIYSVLGSLQQTTINNNRVDVTSLKEGVYLVTINTINSLINKRLVIKK